MTLFFCCLCVDLVGDITPCWSRWSVPLATPHQNVSNHLQVSRDTVKELHSIRLQRHYSPPSLKGVKNIGIDEFAVNIFVRTVIRRRSIPFTIAAEPEKSIRKKAIKAIRDIRREAMSRRSTLFFLPMKQGIPFITQVKNLRPQYLQSTELNRFQTEFGFR